MVNINPYIFKRLLFTVVSLFVVSVLVFFLTQILPGGAAQMRLGTFATEERIAQLEAEMNLNQPIYIQYYNWISGFLTGDWGQSLTHDRSVRELVVPRFFRSLTLATLTTVLIILVGIPIGVLSAYSKKESTSNIINVFSYLGTSTPEFVSGTVLLLLFAGPFLQLFPPGGYVGLEEGILPWLHHLLLPVITLAIILLAHVVRQTRSGVTDALLSEYVRTARLKGLPEWSVVFVHALRNGLLPTITVLALNFGWLMGSLVVVEEVFTFPGLGRLTVGAIQNRDIPVIQASVLLISAVYILANLVADLTYTYLDPRIGYGDK